MRLCANPYCKKALGSMSPSILIQGGIVELQGHDHRYLTFIDEAANGVMVCNDDCLIDFLDTRREDKGWLTDRRYRQHHD